MTGIGKWVDLQEESLGEVHKCYLFSDPDHGLTAWIYYPQSLFSPHLFWLLARTPPTFGENRSFSRMVRRQDWFGWGLMMKLWASPGLVVMI